MIELSGDGFERDPMIDEELMQLGSEMLRDGIDFAKNLKQHIPPKGDRIEIKKHPYIKGKALVSNGGDVGVIDISDEEFSEDDWSIYVYDPRGDLSLALKDQEPGTEMFVSMPLSIHVTMTHPDAKGTLHPIHLRVTEDSRTRQKVSNIQQDVFSERKGMQPANINTVRRASILVQKVKRLTREKVTSPI